MRAVQKISDDWVFHDHFVPELIAELWDGEAVSLPHNAVKLPFNYFSESGGAKVGHGSGGIMLLRAE